MVCGGPEPVPVENDDASSAKFDQSRVAQFAQELGGRLLGGSDQVGELFVLKIRLVVTQALRP